MLVLVLRLRIVAILASLVLPWPSLIPLRGPLIMTRIPLYIASLSLLTLCLLHQSQQLLSDCLLVLLILGSPLVQLSEDVPTELRRDRDVGCKGCSEEIADKVKAGTAQASLDNRGVGQFICLDASSAHFSEEFVCLEQLVALDAGLDEASVDNEARLDSF